MTTPARVQRAAAILADLPTILADGGLPDVDQVTITVDPSKVDKAASLRGGVLVLLPGPALEWPRPGVTVVTWSLVLVGSPTDLVETWGRLDAVLEALRLGGLDMVEATPDGYPRPDSQVVLPGYTITLTETFRD
jgi:hypothetical protein